MIRSMIATAVKAGAFNELGDLIVGRITDRLMPLLEKLNSRLSQSTLGISKRFQGMGVKGLLLQQFLEDMLSSFVEQKAKENPRFYALMTPERIGSVLDGIDETELAVATDQLKSLVYNAAMKVLEEAENQ